MSSILLDYYTPEMIGMDGGFNSIFGLTVCVGLYAWYKFYKSCKNNE